MVEATAHLLVWNRAPAGSRFLRLGRVVKSQPITRRASDGVNDGDRALRAFGNRLTDRPEQGSRARESVGVASIRGAASHDDEIRVPCHVEEAGGWVARDDAQVRFDVRVQSPESCDGLREVRDVTL